MNFILESFLHTLKWVRWCISFCTNQIFMVILETYKKWFYLLKHITYCFSEISADESLLPIRWKLKKLSFYMRKKNAFYFPNIYYVRKVLQSWKNSTLRFWRIYTFWGLENSFMLFSSWSMYVCVYMCVHACVYVCICVCMPHTARVIHKTSVWRLNTSVISRTSFRCV